jgi:hypothetical protein
MTDREKTCPKCGGTMHTIWKGGPMKMVDRCCDDTGCECRYESAPYEAPPRAMELTKAYTWAGAGGGWSYELFDARGYTRVLSQTFGSREKAEVEARDTRERYERGGEYGQCTVVLWPPRVTVNAEIIERERV